MTAIADQWLLRWLKSYLMGGLALICSHFVGLSVVESPCSDPCLLLVSVSGHGLMEMETEIEGAVRLLVSSGSELTVNELQSAV